jgi:hypothetical protein
MHTLQYYISYAQSHTLMELLQQSDTLLEQTPMNAALPRRSSSSPAGAAGSHSPSAL